MFLMSPGTTLLCISSVLVVLCSGLDFKEDGKYEFSLLVYRLRNPIFLMTARLKPCFSAKRPCSRLNYVVLISVYMQKLENGYFRSD